MYLILDDDIVFSKFQYIYKKKSALLTCYYVSNSCMREPGGKLKKEKHIINVWRNTVTLTRAVSTVFQLH